TPLRAHSGPRRVKTCPETTDRPPTGSRNLLPEPQRSAQAKNDESGPVWMGADEKEERC
ncbi:unnamed protein product, partial [Penicillium egyptiacum]